MDTKIVDIVDKAQVGGVLTSEEIEQLYALETFSQEAAYAVWTARQMSVKASGGIAEIHAQIGLNASPCPKNCWFCSFAACNGLRKSVVETPLDAVREYAQIYEEEGANLILLLVTANYKFEKLLAAVAAVREVISPALPLLANTGDFSLAQGQALKAAGVDGVYHAVRMGEGVVTGIDPEVRLATVAAAKEAGLKLCTCVEPIGPEHTPAELAAATVLSRDLHPVFSGAGKRITVPGSKLEANGMSSETRMALYVAVYRLATGYECALNCSGHSLLTINAGANIAWAEVGTNPRDLTDRTEQGGKGDNIANIRKMYTYAEWEIRQGPSPYWQD
jgi:biotin synthase